MHIRTHNTITRAHIRRAAMYSRAPLSRCARRRLCAGRALEGGRGGGLFRDLGNNTIGGTVPASLSALTNLLELCAARTPAALLDEGCAACVRAAARGARGSDRGSYWLRPSGDHGRFFWPCADVGAHFTNTLTNTHTRAHARAHTHTLTLTHARARTHPPTHTHRHTDTRRATAARNALPQARSARRRRRKA